MSARVLDGPAPRRLAALPLQIVDGVPAVAGGFIGRAGFESRRVSRRGASNGAVHRSTAEEKSR